MGKGNKQYYEFSNYIEETNNEHDSKNKIKIFIIVVILILFIGLILIAMNVKQTIDISKSQKEIAENLNAVSNKTTRLDEEKAKLAYTWILNNITYDYDCNPAYQYSNLDKTLQTKKGICYDIAL